MVRTRVQHVRGGRREPKCWMSAHGVSGAFEARGGEAGGSGPSWVVAEIDGCLRDLFGSVIVGGV